MIRKIHAFTLIEIIIVMIILGTLAAVALVRYTGSVRQSNERDAVQQLRTINAANEIYLSRNGQYLPGAGGLDVVNSGLGLNTVYGSFAYGYSQLTATTYQVDAILTGGNSFSLKITQGAITNSNPCCSAGTCPSVPAC